MKQYLVARRVELQVTAHQLEMVKPQVTVVLQDLATLMVLVFVLEKQVLQVLKV
jgi:hypothetical protein